MKNNLKVVTNMGWFSNRKQSESSSDLIVNALNKSLAVIEFEPNGKIITANANFLNLMEYQLVEVQGQQHTLFVHPVEARSDNYKNLWQRLQKGEFISDEFKRFTKNGKELWIQETYSPVVDSHGQILKVVKFANDITSQKLNAAETSSQVNAINKSQAIVEFNLDGSVIDANANFLSAFGYQLSEIKGLHHRIFVESEYAESDDYKAFWEKLGRGEFDSGEYLRLGKQGQEIWIQASYNPIFDLNGKPFKVIKYATDITAQKELEKSSRKAADLASALNVCQANVMIADKDLNIVFANNCVQKMLKAREKELQIALPNFSVNSLVGTCVDDFHKHPGHQRHILQNLGAPHQVELNIAGLVFTLTASPWLSHEGERLGTIVEWEDRTAEVAIEKEIAELVSAAGHGDLDARVLEEGKEGFFLRLAQGLNSLVTIVEDAVTDTANMLDAMASGDLSQRIEKDYQGSFDKLKRDANATADKLTEVINRINSSATLVASGAEEISQGNADLSQRTEEQASSLEQTAASMEEMTSTVRQNADNAKVANDLAEETCTKAIEGGEVVNKAVTSMSAINESSKKIADIIGVIDEIAFQTNLLALNAAVEAARAGEQGRGFAVVAGEVRNLAQRSAGAAKEIKELIRDSVGKVADGTLLVNESGTTLKEIVVSVKRVTQMISDITEASEEQSAGIEQVNKAISQMDEMTQQNAALVEQASAAGESMAEQAKEMSRLLHFFSLGQQDVAMISSNVSTQEPSHKPNSNYIGNNTRGDNFIDSAEQWEEF